MRATTILILLVILSFTINAQHQIQNIRVEPQNPSTDDQISVIVDFQFTSGACIRDASSHSISGNRIIAASHYCVGALTVICPASDTFKLGVLAAGAYTFHSVLTSGALPTPCTPGIVGNDMDSLVFNVNRTMSIKTYGHSEIKIIPGSSEGLVDIYFDETWKGSIMRIYSVEGKLIHVQKVTNSIERVKLNAASAVYLLNLANEESSFNTKFILP